MDLPDLQYSYWVYSSKIVIRVKYHIKNLNLDQVMCDNFRADMMSIKSELITPVDMDLDF